MAIINLMFYFLDENNFRGSKKKNQYYCIITRLNYLNNNNMYIKLNVPPVFKQVTIICTFN